MVSPSLIRKLVVGGAVLWAVALAAALPELWERGSVVRVLGWTYTPPDQAPRITRVTPGGPADGLLRVGDRIVSIDGQVAYAPALQAWAFPPGAVYRLQVDRAGQLHTVTLRVGSRPASQWPLIASLLFGSLTFASIAWLMGWQRPEFLTARLGWVASQLTAFVYLGLALSVVQSQGWAPSVLHCLLRLVGNSHLWFVFWFVAEFPYSPPASRRWQRIRLALGAMAFVTWFVIFCSNVALIAGPAGAASLPLWWNSVHVTFATLNVVSQGAGVAAVLVRNHRVLTEPAARASIRLVAGAIALGLGTVGVLQFIAFLSAQAPTLLANLAPLPIPLCFAYGVLRHRVLDLRLALHRGLQYLLARQLLRALTLLPLALMVIRAIADPSAPIGSLFNIVGIALVAAAALALEFRERLRNWLDRWYQRPRLQREQQLRALAAEVPGQPWEELEQAVPPRLMAMLDVVSAGFEGQGTLKLGPRTSGEPFTESEQHLLALVTARLHLEYEKWLLAQGHTAAIQTERQRIAREIHDTAGHGFAGIALYLDAARKTFHAGAPREASQFLEEAGALARKSLRETRASIADLREAPSVDLAARLHELASRNHAGPPCVSVHVEPEALPRVSAAASWHLARIAEEAVVNACKHASASQIRVDLQALDQALRLRVHDNGRGFDPDLAGGQGFGLSGMKERTEQLRGTLTVVSSPGQGTEISAEVPA